MSPPDPKADYGLLRGLLFDFDGTLIDSELDLHLPAFNQAFADAELAWHWDVSEYTQLLEVPGGHERICAYAEKRCPELSAAQRHTLASKLHTAKNARVQQRLNDRPLSLRPGMGKLLNQASRAGLRLGIASTANSRTIESALSGALAQNVWELFDTIIGGDQVARVKPAPDVYLQALKNLQLDASEAIAIEDSPPGLASAQAAGLVTVIWPNAMTCSENFDTAALVLDYQGDHANHTLPSASTQTHASDLIGLDRLAALLG